MASPYDPVLLVLHLLESAAREPRDRFGTHVRCLGRLSWGLEVTTDLMKFGVKLKAPFLNNDESVEKERDGDTIPPPPAHAPGAERQPAALVKKRFGAFWHPNTFQHNSSIRRARAAPTAQPCACPYLHLCCPHTHSKRKSTCCDIFSLIPPQTLTPPKTGRGNHPVAAPACPEHQTHPSNARPPL